jgi:hypothetical protein
VLIEDSPETAEESQRIERMKQICLQKSAESAQSADRFLAFGTLNQEQHSRGRPQALVERRLDPADRRSVLVALTDEGARLLERVRADRIQAMEQLLRSLSAEERALLYDILGKLLSELSGETTPVGQL